MKLNIPKGSEINKKENEIITLRVPNTIFLVQLEQKPDKTWDMYLINPETTYKEIVRTNMSSKALALFSERILKTPFPFYG